MGNPSLRSVPCHMEWRSCTCHPAQVKILISECVGLNLLLLFPSLASHGKVDNFFYRYIYVSRRTSNGPCPRAHWSGRNHKVIWTDNGKFLTPYYTRVTAIRGLCHAIPLHTDYETAGLQNARSFVSVSASRFLLSWIVEKHGFRSERYRDILLRYRKQLFSPDLEISLASVADLGFSQRGDNPLPPSSISFLPPLFPFPFPPLFLSLPPSLRSRTRWIQLGGMGSAVSSPAGSGSEPQPKSNLVHFGLKI